MATPSSICYSIITSILAATAFLLCWAAEFGCNFVSFTSTTGFTQPVAVQFGLWSYQFWTVATSIGGSVIFESCHKYPSETNVDGSWKAARAFSILALIFGGVFLLKNLISGCITPLRRASISEGPAFLAAGVFQGLSLLLLQSSVCKDNDLMRQLERDAERLGNVGMSFPDTCSVSTGANCAIAATVIWALAALTSYMGVVAERREEAADAATTEPLIPGENL
ncbi:hypothetical protein ACHAXT_012048 [Thalassiosira profunda]